VTRPQARATSVAPSSAKEATLKAARIVASMAAVPKAARARSMGSSQPRAPAGRSQVAPAGLLPLDRREQRAEVPHAEPLGTAALDDLVEQRRSVLDRLGEDLQEVALLVTVDQDAAPARSSQDSSTSPIRSRTSW
jgi:hypothetical protein